MKRMDLPTRPYTPSAYLGRLAVVAANTVNLPLFDTEIKL